MSNIDWDAAPESATHARNCNWETPDWYKISNGVLMVHSCGGPWEESGYESMESVPGLQSRPSVIWQGTGLPPVGTVCEYTDMHGVKWYGCEIIARHGEHVWLRTTAAKRDHVKIESAFRFRPIRTQAQIEAEERESAIQEIASMIGRGNFYEDAARIYDAGYRKQPKEDA